MGAWGHGPLETDDAADVIGAVRHVLDQGWEALREDELDDAGLALASETAAIALSLLRGGIRVEPDDRDELVDAWGDDLPAVVVAALTADAASERPGFPDERAVERWLREAEAPYEVWMAAAAYGDDRALAWRATTDPSSLVVMAKLAGVPEREVVRAVAACVLARLGTPTQQPYLAARDALAILVAGEPIDEVTVGRLRTHIKTLRDRRSAEYAAARARGETPSLPDEPQLPLVNATEWLVKGKLVVGLRSLADVPDFGVNMRELLDPLVAGRLSLS